MYAVIAAGGAYVPLDPDHPAERIGHILTTADPVCVLSTTRDAFVAPNGADVLLIDNVDLSSYSASVISDADRRGRLHDVNAAYVIFTSGSTGKPKGVAVSHHAIVNQVLWMQDQYAIGQKTSICRRLLRHSTSRCGDTSLRFCPVREWCWHLTTAIEIPRIWLV